jgi:hypothetical protein
MFYCLSMFFDPEITPDPEVFAAPGSAGEKESQPDADTLRWPERHPLPWDHRPDYAEEADAAAREAAALCAPDTMDHVIEIADMMTIHAAQRLIGIDFVVGKRTPTHNGRVVSSRTSSSGRCGWRSPPPCASPNMRPTIC